MKNSFDGLLGYRFYTRTTAGMLKLCQIIMQPLFILMVVRTSCVSWYSWWISFDYHAALLQATSANSPPRHLSYPYFCEYFRHPLLYDSWYCDALLNYLNDVYFGSLVRTSCESCSFSMIYCSRLAIKAIGGNESAEIHFHKFKLALIYTQV